MVLPSFLYSELLVFQYFLLFSEDAYRIDVEVDGEGVGLDIIDTAGQVRYTYCIYI